MVRLLQEMGEARVKIQVWLTVNNGSIEFLTLDDSYKFADGKNPRVVCYIGDKEGPSVSGTAEIFMGSEAIWRVYRAYWKTHPLIMAFIAFSIRRRIRTHKRFSFASAPMCQILGWRDDPTV